MTREPTTAQRILAVVGSVVALCGALFLELVAFILHGVRCNEGCDGPRGDWRYDEGAWQWDLQLGWATVGVMLAVGMVVLAALGRLRAAGLVLIVALATYAGWWAFAIG